MGQHHHTDNRSQPDALWPSVLIIFALAWLLNNVAGIWLLHSPPMLDDAQDYFDRAVQLWQGLDNGKAHYWPPGGPYTLAALFSVMGTASQGVAQWFMSGLSALTTALVFALASSVFSDRRASWLATALYGLSPTTVWMARQSESHTFCAFWIALSVYLAVRYLKQGRALHLLLAALATGMLVLTRPGSALLVLLLGALPLARKWMARSTPQAEQKSILTSVIAPSMCALLLVAAMLAPVLQFNASRGAGLVLSTNNERNFFLGNNPYTHPYKTGHLAWRPLAELPPETQAYLLSHYKSAEPRKAMLASATSYIQQEPLKFVQRCFNRFINFWSFDYEQGRRLQTHLASYGVLSWLPLMLQAAYSALLIGLLALCLPSLVRQRGWVPVAGLLGICLIYQLPHIVAFSSPVYRAGLNPLICALAAASMVAAWDKRPAATPGQGGWARSSLIYGALVSVALIAIDAQAAYYLVTLR